MWPDNRSVRYETVQKLSDEDFKRSTGVSRVMFEKMLKIFRILSERYRNRRKRFGLRFNFGLATSARGLFCDLASSMRNVWRTFFKAPLPGPPRISTKFREGMFRLGHLPNKCKMNFEVPRTLIASFLPHFVF